VENKAVPNLQLKSEREQRFWTQEDVAKQVGTSAVNVSRWERGITSPSLFFRNKLCEIFGKSAQELGLVADDDTATSFGSGDYAASSGNHVGEVLGEYRLNHQMGRGEFADVYFGEHVRRGNEVVVKVLTTRLTGEDELNFLSDARAVARLVHPHILRLLDFGVEAGIPYLVMDYAPKGCLRYPKGEHVSTEVVVSYAKQIAEALQYAHGKQVIHRNIKPENVLLGGYDEVLLADFGIAWVTQGPHSQTGKDVSAALAYMAPELLQGKPGPASDQYALAAMVYEWLTGDVPPFQGSLIKVAGQTVLVLAPPPSLRGKLLSISPEVEGVVLTALAQDPGQRFGSVQAFANALEQAYRSGSKDSTVELDRSTVPLSTRPSAPDLPVAPRPPLQTPLGPAPVAPRPSFQAPPSALPVVPRPPLQTPPSPAPVGQQRSSFLPPFSAAPTSPPPLTQQPRRAVPPPWRRRRFFLPLLILLLLAVIFGIIASLFFRSGSSSLTPVSITIVVTSAKDGEPIGISDGTRAFDTGRPDGNLKLRAADRLKAGDVTGAESLWNQALAIDTNDAEALIYQEDQRVLGSDHPYITLVAGTVLTGAFADTGRASLQGAYVAQKEYNDQCFRFPNCMPVRLLVANAGSGDSSNGQVGYASLVMEQIVKAAQADKTIVGVMGWPLSSSSLYVNTILGSAGIPVVSPTALIAPAPSKQPYIFSVAPSLQRQGSVGAQYAEQGLHARRVALFVDPVDRYSESLAGAFIQQFTADGNQIVDTENYTVGQLDTISPDVQAALNHHPDMIYFAGHVNDLGGLLPYLPPCGPASCLQVLGGDALYELTGSINPPPNLYRLHFTAYAYPGEENNLAPSAQQIPAFYTEYPEDFDPQNQHGGGAYGYRRADSGVILSYDATQTLLNASSIASSGGKQSITPGDLQHALTQITGLQAWQGVSGRISFGPDGTPSNKVVVVLHWSTLNRLTFDTAYGCFLKPLPTAPPNAECS
jgi:eukaryotic-like serine/threonine-protein kinase